MTARLEGVMDALLISTSQNRRYLSEFTGSAGFPLLTTDQASLATDGHYSEQAVRESTDCEVLTVERGRGWLLDRLIQNSMRRRGFESSHMLVATYQSLIEWLGEDQSLCLVPADDTGSEQRTLKDAEKCSSAAKGDRRLRCRY